MPRDPRKPERPAELACKSGKKKGSTKSHLIDGTHTLNAVATLDRSGVALTIVTRTASCERRRWSRSYGEREKEEDADGGDASEHGKVWLVKLWKDVRYSEAFFP